MKQQEFSLDDLQHICQIKQVTQNQPLDYPTERQPPQIISYECGRRQTFYRKKQNRIKVEDQNWIQKVIDQDGDAELFQCKKFRIGAIAKDGTLCTQKHPQLANGICSRHGGVGKWLYRTQRIKIRGSGKFLFQDYFTSEMIDEYLEQNFDKIKIYEKSEYTLFMERLGQWVKKLDQQILEKIKSLQEANRLMNKRGSELKQLSNQNELIENKLQFAQKSDLNQKLKRQNQTVEAKTQQQMRPQYATNQLNSIQTSNQKLQKELKQNVRYLSQIINQVLKFNYDEPKLQLALTLCSILQSRQEDLLNRKQSQNVASIKERYNILQKQCEQTKKQSNVFISQNKQLKIENQKLLQQVTMSKQQVIKLKQQVENLEKINSQNSFKIQLNSIENVQLKSEIHRFEYMNEKLKQQNMKLNSMKKQVLAIMLQNTDNKYVQSKEKDTINDRKTGIQCEIIHKFQERTQNKDNLKLTINNKDQNLPMENSKLNQQKKSSKRNQSVKSAKLIKQKQLGLSDKKTSKQHSKQIKIIESNKSVNILKTIQ